MHLHQAERRQARIKLALQGSAGSGKDKRDERLFSLKIRPHRKRKLFHKDLLEGADVVLRSPPIPVQIARQKESLSEDAQEVTLLAGIHLRQWAS